jgi:hypothetical protein
MAFEAELVLQHPDDRLDALPQPIREYRAFSSLRAGRIRSRSTPGLAKKVSVPSPGRPLSVTMAVPSLAPHANTDPGRRATA